jgi:hypothetical protein
MPTWLLNISIPEWLAHPNFDVGGFVGGVLGAIAAGFGVIYSLRKTAQFERRKQEAMFRALRSAVITEVKLAVSNLAHFDFGLRVEPRHEVTSDMAFRWWRSMEPQFYEFRPTVIPANLQNIALFPENEISLILTVQGAISEFAEALAAARACNNADGFASVLRSLLVKRAQLIGQLQQFFSEMAPRAKINDADVLPHLSRLGQELPKYWTKIAQ